MPLQPFALMADITGSTVSHGSCGSDGLGSARGRRGATPMGRSSAGCLGYFWPLRCVSVLLAEMVDGSSLLKRRAPNSWCT
mmetsp:Transcript_184919/g.586680  ORF Transcript_184919/g.586680 Transcript_184919/m.586680 type:complete len:81 (+) Transcript_184919:1008-1250(+)